MGRVSKKQGNKIMFFFLDNPFCGFQIKFDNGYMVSAISTCADYCPTTERLIFTATQSKTVEMAIKDYKKDEFVQFGAIYPESGHNDDILRHRTPEEFVEILNIVSKLPKINN